MAFSATINPFADGARTKHLLSKEPRLKILYCLRLFTVVINIAGLALCGIAYKPLGYPENYGDADVQILVASMSIPALAWSLFHNLLNILFVHFAQAPLHPGWNIGYDLGVFVYLIVAGTFMEIFQVDTREPYSLEVIAVGALCFVGFITHFIMFAWACRRVHQQRVQKNKEIIDLRNQLDIERSRNSEANNASERA